METEVQKICDSLSIGGIQYPNWGDDGAHEGSWKVEATFQKRKMKQNPMGLYRLK